MANNKPIETYNGLDFSPRLDDACQYSTVYRDGKPVATLQRRRVLASGPVWRLYTTDGKELGPGMYFTNYTAVAMRVSYRINEMLRGE